MESQIDGVIDCLAGEDQVREFYVLVRDLKLWIDFGPSATARIGVRVYRSPVIEGNPYHFETSHYAHSPTQATPYMTSNNSAQTENEAIRQAIRSITMFIRGAITAGHEFDPSWLVVNDDF